MCSRKSFLVSKSASPSFCPLEGLPCEQPPEDSKSSSAGVSKQGRSICLLTLCILVWDFLEELTLLLYWLRSTETPIYQAQSFSVNIIYENLSCLTFSFLGTQFMKPKSKRRVCQICWFHCIVKERGQKGPVFGPQGPVLYLTFHTWLPLCQTRSTYCMVRVLSHTRQYVLRSALCRALPTPCTAWSTLVKQPTSLPIISFCPSDRTEHNNKCWKIYKKWLLEGTEEQPKEDTFWSVLGGTICYMTLHVLSRYAKDVSAWLLITWAVTQGWICSKQILKDQIKFL